MFGFMKKSKEDDEANKTKSAVYEVLVREEGAILTLRRLIEAGLVSREDVIKFWTKADKERRRYWKNRQPTVEFYGSLVVEKMIDNDDDDDF